MKLLKVTFQDYRVYAGRQTIDFSPAGPSQPIILVGGLNGEGKTTLLEGIQLALYGRNSDVWKHNGTSYSEYLIQSIHRGSMRGTGALVEVEFDAIDQGELKSIRIQRSWKISENGKVNEYTQAFVDNALDEILSETWQDQVDRFIPARLAGLFFFDGEKIRHYADPQKSQELLEKGILSLLGIDLVDQLSTDLKALKRDLTKSARSTKLDELLNQLEDNRRARLSEIEELNDKIGQLNNDLDLKKKELEQLENQFEKQGGSLFDQRAKIEKELETLKERRSGIERAFAELSAEALPLALVSGHLASCTIQMEIEINVARARVTKKAVESQKKRLKKKFKSKRVAARTLDILSDFYAKELRELREISELPSYLGTSELDCFKASQLNEEGIPEALDRAVSLVGEFDNVEAKLQSLSRKLSSVPDDDSIAEIVLSRETARRDHSVVEGRVLQLKEDLRVARVHLEEAENALDKHLIKRLEKSQGAKANLRIIEHADLIRETLAAFRSRLIMRRIELLQDSILESYNSLMRKKGMVADLRIDPSTFSLSLKSRSGSEVPPDWLSAGERQLLVVAILWGLARASGKALPIIVDTPVGRLDSTHRANLVHHYFPLASHQVVLLSTDEEIVGSTLKRLTPSLAKKYRLVYDDKTESTRIEPGYFMEREHAN